MVSNIAGSVSRSIYMAQIPYYHWLTNIELMKTGCGKCILNIMFSHDVYQKLSFR